MARAGKEWSPGGRPIPFRKGDRIVPKGGKYPEEALEVLETSRAGNFRASPLGGGPVYTFTPRDREKYGFRTVTKEETRPVWRKGRFSMDFMGEKSVEGWTTGDLWNGWATPFFEKAAGEEALRELEASYAEMNQKYVWSYDPKGDAFVLRDPNWDEPERITGEWTETPEGRKKLYGIGAYSWTWTED